jgi:hypothetical protein
MTLLGRYYERYADHAVGVARRIVFIATGAMPAGSAAKLPTPTPIDGVTQWSADHPAV